MSDLPPSSSEAQNASVKRGIRWDALAAIIASFVGLLALIVAGYTAHIQRQQVRAQVWPYLEIRTFNGLGYYKLVAFNKGVGPLVVQSVQVLAAGKPVPDWETLDRLLGFEPKGGVVGASLNKTVLAPGGQIPWLIFQNAADVDAFAADWARSHVVARVCYSSTLGDSWLTVFVAGETSTTRAVPDCPILPVSAQFSD
jgi:hypothetical protein